MPDIGEIYTGNYLGKEDFPQPQTLTISSVVPEQVGQEKETKLVLYFQGKDQGMTLNKTNAQIVAALHGRDYSLWAGKLVGVANDPTVQFKGQVTGGLRIQQPMSQQAPPAQQQQGSYQ